MEEGRRGMDNPPEALDYFVVRIQQMEGVPQVFRHQFAGHACKRSFQVDGAGNLEKVDEFAELMVADTLVGRREEALPSLPEALVQGDQGGSR